MYPRDSLWLCLVSYSSSSFIFSLFSSSAGASLFHPVLSRLLNLPTFFQRLWKKRNRECGLLVWQKLKVKHKAYSPHKRATNYIVFRVKTNKNHDS